MAPTKMSRVERKAAEDAALHRHIHDDAFQHALARAHFESHAKSCSITPYGMKVELTGLPPAALERVLDAIDSFRREPETTTAHQLAAKGMV